MIGRPAPFSSTGHGVRAGSLSGVRTSAVTGRSGLPPDTITPLTSQIENIGDPRYVRALGHPLRVRILAILEERTASAVELSRLLHADIGVVAYHVRKLHQLGLIERGAAWRGVRASRKAFERLAEDVLDRADAAASDPRLALSALLGMVNHTAQWYRPRGRLTATEIADGYTDLVLGASRAGTP